MSGWRAIGTENSGNQLNIKVVENTVVITLSFTSKYEAQVAFEDVADSYQRDQLIAIGTDKALKGLTK